MVRVWQPQCGSLRTQRATPNVIQDHMVVLRSRELPPKCTVGDCFLEDSTFLGECARFTLY